jgi:CheY-like chemotaxis protein
MTKILIVDDDPMVRRTIGRILRNRGYELVFAEDGQQGLEMFCSEDPALVITDMIMPRKEGAEMIADIRVLRPDAKIIAISGGARLDDVDFSVVAERLGVCAAVEKPFDPFTLLDSVGRCLGSIVPAAVSRS